MNSQRSADQLERQATIIEGFLQGLSDVQSRWRPDDKAWSILEVACHLLDEEREDFRARLAHLLGPNPNDPLPPIDPQGWVKARDYNSQDLKTVLESFKLERVRSVEWLRKLESPVWDNTNHHPAGFDIRAGDMLAAWIDHDLHHIRQLTDLHHALVDRESEPYVTLYAGEW